MRAFISFLIFIWPVKKADLAGEYAEIFSGIFFHFGNYGFVTIDDQNFHNDLGWRYKDLAKTQKLHEGVMRYSYKYEYKNNNLTYNDPGYEKVIRHWFSDKVEGTSLVKYKVIKIGSRVILFGGDYNRILVKVNRKTRPGSDGV